MNTEIELRNWLNRDDKNFIENIEFGIKVWNSIEFVLLTKHEVIVDEFCNNLSKLRDATKRQDDAVAFLEQAWSVINEFLSLQYSAGAVSVAVKDKLIKALTKEAQSKSNRKKCSPLILNALLTTLKSTSMQNFYKSNTEEYAKYVAVCLSYLSVIASNSGDNMKSDELKANFELILNEVKAFIKQTPFIETFKLNFVDEIIGILCELVIVFKSHGIDSTGEMFSLLQELFFDGSQTNDLKRSLTSPTTVTNEYARLFNVPIHVFMIIIETIFISYRSDSDVQKLLFHYLLNDETGRFCTTTADIDQRRLLQCISLFIALTKKHDIPLNFSVNETKVLTFLGKRIENIVSEHQTNFVHETLSIVCATLKLNPLILEHSAYQIAVKFMLAPKTEDSVWSKYEELMSLLIEMHRKLSRAEKFISQLLRQLNETLATTKLSKKLKRSFNASLIADETPTKKLKSNKSNGVADASLSEGDKSKDDVDFIELIEKYFVGDSTARLNDIESHSASNWNDILFAFTPRISQLYTRFISNLVSKPSLVVWKTLIFTLKEHIEQLNNANGKSTENLVFLIEITSALLTQYFHGSRLAEQADKSWQSIDENRQLTQNVLADFGRAILNQEHNYRTMNSFLKLCLAASNFDLLCWYYCPDSMNPENASSEYSDLPKIDGKKSAKEIHSYLSSKEWTIIEQRITNFGKRECKMNFNKIHLQRMKAKQLFAPLEKSTSFDVSKHVLTATFDDVEQIVSILSDATMANWFIVNLNSAQKQNICELLLQAPEGIEVLESISFSDREFVDILILSIYKSLIEIFADCKVGEHLKAIEWTKCLNGSRQEVAEQLRKALEKILKKNLRGDEKTVENSFDEIKKYLQLLLCLPIGFCPKDAKSTVFMLTALVYRNVLVNDELSQMAMQLFKIIFHFDEFPSIFEIITIESLSKLFIDETDAHSIYEMIFDRASNQFTDGDVKIFDELNGKLQEYNEIDESQQKVFLQIAICATVSLSKIKKCKEIYDKLRVNLYEIVQREVKSNENEIIEKTLPAFATVANTMIAKHECDDDFVQVFKLFARKSVNCENQFAVKLLSSALSNKVTLKYSSDELKELVDCFWTDFKRKCPDRSECRENIKLTEIILKNIFDSKSVDDWTDLLVTIEKEVRFELSNDEECIVRHSKIIASMARCQLNKVKGLKFSDFFKKITFWIRLSALAKSNDLMQNYETIIHLLDCYAIFIDNVQVPASMELIDDIISLLSEINVKTIVAQTFDSKRFVRLVDRMIDVAQSLINHRHVFVLDRVPQFVHVFKDLLQTICWYKSNRNKQAQLEQAEVTMLAEMAHKLEKLNKTFVKHANEVKRVAPYLLVFTINLMIGNDRPTTLYPKIKTHIEYICYDLIAICDHRADSFILRNCNEASKPVYESLHKEYEKYFKFKGKV